MPQSQRRYLNPDEKRSGNQHPSRFKFPQLVESSTLRKHLRPVVKYFLSHDRFGETFWAATETIANDIGCHRTTVQRSVDELLRELYDCEDCGSRDTLDRIAPKSVRCTCDFDRSIHSQECPRNLWERKNGHCRRCSAQYRAICAVATRNEKTPPLPPPSNVIPTGLRIFEQIEQANEWVEYGGGVHFRPTATYKLNPFALRQRKTYKQYAEERNYRKFKIRQGQKRRPQQQVSIPPPALVPPAPPSQRKLNDRTIRVLAKGINYYMAGNTKDEFGYKLQPNDNRYRAPLKREEAIRQTCKDEGIDVQAALESQLRAGHRDLRERGSPEGESR